MSLNTVMNKEGVRLKGYLLIILSYPCTVVFCFVNAEPQAMSSHGALLLPCTSPRSRKGTVGRVITGRAGSWIIMSVVEGTERKEGTLRKTKWYEYVKVWLNDCNLPCSLNARVRSSLRGWLRSLHVPWHTHALLAQPVAAELDGGS